MFVSAQKPMESFYFEINFLNYHRRHIRQIAFVACVNFYIIIANNISLSFPAFDRKIVAVD